MKKILRTYDRLAGEYDRRWQAYLGQTLDRAITLINGGTEPRILKIACGTGEFIRRLLEKFPAATVAGVDGSSEMLAQASAKFSKNPRVSLHRATAQTLPFQNASFDWVVCCNSLHCFPDAKEAICEMARVLKPGGRSLILDWCRDPWHCCILDLWLGWFDSSHIKTYTTKELRQMVEARAISIEQIKRFRVAIGRGPKIWEMMACVARLKEGDHDR